MRYNPGGDAAMNARQAARLAQLSDYLRAHNRLYMFELLVLPEARQLESVRDKAAYDVDLRPGLMVDAIRQLQDAGVEADVWKIEGLDRQSDCERVVEAAQRDGRSNVGCIILGRGENDQKVVEWLQTAAAVPGFTDFAVGRTSFWDALLAWRDGQLSVEDAADRIAVRYCQWVSVFEEARAHTGVRR